jgi:hypothetical protein
VDFENPVREHEEVNKKKKKDGRVGVGISTCVFVR